MRTLLLMRHARADSYADRDHARPLTDRGRSDAAEVGRWLASRGLVPDAAVVSTAVRAQETYERVAAASRARIEPIHDEGLYSSGPDTALDILRESGADGAVVLFVGHNPTVASLAHALSDGQPEAAAFRVMSQGYPPAAVAVLEVRGDWADLAEGSARIVDFHVGRG